ncbi:MAG: polyphosphate kinase 2 family protein [Vicinamibacterales bacterium]
MDFRQRYRVSPGHAHPLAKVDPGSTAGSSKARAKRQLERGIERLAELQERLYASDTWSVLVIFQAMDAAGKDSTIKHVMSGVNPQGCQVFSFKAPSPEELDHDYLWRSVKALPERGRIGIHNRSYYEEVLVTRVHPDILARQRLPVPPGPGIWTQRFREMVAFERHLHANGTTVVKFFLHVSKEEQRQRFLERLDNPDKMWKFSMSDVAERARWSDYMAAYDDMLRHTSTKDAPWYVVPADHKWYTRLVVAEIIADTLDGLKLKYPSVAKSERDRWREARKALGKG